LVEIDGERVKVMKGKVEGGKGTRARRVQGYILFRWLAFSLGAFFSSSALIRSASSLVTGFGLAMA